MEFDDVIPNAEFIIELLNVILKNSLMTFNGEYFQQIFGVIMGTNVAPILANIYLAILEKLLKDKCKFDKKLIWPVMFKRFIDDGFGITNGSKSDFEYWVSEFNLLRESITIDKFKYGDKVDFMDLVIFKGDKFASEGIFDISVFQKSENKYMYIPAKSGHAKHTIKNFVLGELKRYVRFNSIKSNFLKIRNNFFVRLRDRGYKKSILKKFFGVIKFESRKKLLAISTKNQDFCEIRETEVNCSIIEDAERIFSDSFLEETNQNQRSNFHIASVTIPSVHVPPKKVGCFTVVHTIFCHKKKLLFCASYCICNVFRKIKELTGYYLVALCHSKRKSNRFSEQKKLD